MFKPIWNISSLQNCGFSSQKLAGKEHIYPVLWTSFKQYLPHVWFNFPWVCPGLAIQAKVLWAGGSPPFLGQDLLPSTGHGLPWPWVDLKIAILDLGSSPMEKNHKNPNPGRTHVNCYQFLPLFERENNWFVHVCTSSPLSPKIKLLKFTQRMNVFGI